MEIKFYEKIGVRQWKKFVLWIAAQILRNPEYRKGTNYYLKSLDLASVKKFRKMLILNGLIHTFFGLNCIRSIICNIWESNIFSLSMLINIVCFLINLYCVLLQRYNWLRIKKVLNKKGVLK